VRSRSRGGYILDLVVVVEPLEDEDDDEEDEDEVDLVVDAEEELAVEELAVVVDAADEINELGAPPVNVNGKL
jgi:hypothetical protein